MNNCSDTSPRCAALNTCKGSAESTPVSCERGYGSDSLERRLSRAVCRFLIRVGSELGTDIVLTEDNVEKVERLLEQTGAPRPGYLRDGRDNVEGDFAPPPLSARQHKAPDGAERRQPIRLSLHWEVDPETGDYDLISD